MRNSSKLGGGHRTQLGFLAIAVAVVLVSGCGGSGGGGASSGFAIGGNVSGLTGGQPFTLQNNGADALTVTASGSFTFAKPAGSYNVTVSTQPAGQTCSVSNGSGSMISANVNNVAVNCSPNTYTVGGTLVGLSSGHQITLENNGTDPLTLTADGTFAFHIPEAYGGNYNVTVTSQPGEASQQLCSIVVGGSGTVSGAVTGVFVSCSSVEQVLYNFSGAPDGVDPEASLIMDNAGNLYGTTRLGSANFGIGYGIVFKLSPTESGLYKETILYSFNGGSDGEQPAAGLTMDGAGNLFGTTSRGGDGSCTNGCGMVFKLSAGVDDHYTKSILHSFTGGGDGLEPSGLILDSAGNLYGTTNSSNAMGLSGNPNAGTVFKLSPNADGSYTESVLYAFTTTDSSNGQNPIGGMIIDSTGALYGTTANGGSGNFGVVFKLSPTTGDSYSESVVFNFGGSGSGVPSGGLVIDSLGNLYGTAGAFGVVFKLAPTADGSYTESLLHSFDGSTADGGDPNGGLIMDSLGNLYGTTQIGGAGGGGMVFRLSPAADGNFTETILYSFKNNTDGGNPRAGLIIDSAGNLYGTTANGGSGVAEGLDTGTVFEIRTY